MSPLAAGPKRPSDSCNLILISSIVLPSLQQAQPVFILSCRSCHRRHIVSNLLCQYHVLSTDTLRSGE